MKSLKVLFSLSLLTVLLIISVSCVKKNTSTEKNTSTTLSAYTYFDSVIVKETISKDTLIGRLDFGLLPAVIALLPNISIKVVTIAYKTKGPQGQ